MNQIKNAAPQIIFWGFDDQSGRAVPSVAESIPIHLPFCYTFARKGETTPMFVAGKAMEDIYGAETFDYRSPYATHATPFINGFNQFANIMMMQRLKPDNAKTATMRLAVEVLPSQVPVYERNADGSYKLDPDKAPIATGATVAGHILKWVIVPIPDDEEIGAGKLGVGSLVEGSTQSVLYPIRDLRISSFGQHGNDTGIRFFPRLNLGLDPVDEDLVMDQKAFMYGMQVMSRVNSQSTATVWKTVNGSQQVQFTLKPGTYNKFTDTELYVGDVFMPNYRNVDDGQFGPFDVDYVYQDNIDTVLEMLFTGEVAANPLGFPSADVENKYLVNFLTAEYLNGAPYHSVLVHGMLDGGIEFTSTNTHYAAGGADGDMGVAEFNKLVARELANFNEGEYLYEDMAKYPFSVVYDTGYDLATKNLLPRILGVRPDVSIALATQDVARKANTVEEDSSIGIALRSRVMASPESLVFGTSACRAIIVLHSGEMATSMGTYKGMLPGTYELAMKRSRYMGSGDGIMKSKWAYDQEETRVITYMKNVTNLSKPQTVRNKDWDRGLTYFQNYDTRRGFHPMTRSVYNDDTSILTSEIVMMIACNVNRVHFEVWRELVGNGKLNDEQFIQKSNEKIQKKTNGRYDKRCVIRPETYYTEEARALGFLWLSRAHIYAPNAKTVAAAAVVMHRLSDLTAG